MTGFGFHTHNIKLTVSPEMDYQLNTLSYSTVCLVPKSRVWCFSQILCKPRVLPWMVMALLYWCLEGWTSHERLANFSIQSAVSIRKIQQGYKLDLWLQLFSYSILYSCIKPTHHPYYYHLQYHYHHEKSCSKQFEFRVFESYSPTQLQLRNRPVLAVIFISSGQFTRKL